MLSKVFGSRLVTAAAKFRRLLSSGDSVFSKGQIGIDSFGAVCVRMNQIEDHLQNSSEGGMRVQLL